MNKVTFFIAILSLAIMTSFASKAAAYTTTTPVEGKKCKAEGGIIKRGFAGFKVESSNIKSNVKKAASALQG